MCQGIINSTEIYVTVKLTKMTLQTVLLLKLVTVFQCTIEGCVLVVVIEAQDSSGLYDVYEKADLLFQKQNFLCTRSI